jgi:hypothetical protein
MKQNDFFDEMAIKWPSPIVARSQVGVFSGGFIAPGTLANLDSQGVGPKERISIGRNSGYTVKSLIEFLRERATIIEAKRGN